ncbi:MAG: type VI secretion system tube protein Hcp [Acidobacteria bacterium]|uniref:Type VI secretion system tube protein Hcp n=1 Tax=Candidatus Polarisedimenticola svalbardensis TaxID=2886004 RepID=A0A8J7CMI1_9BACT|nr:type VI secretion system tube protein Hcp [Candidatus Polarisedimenticola svalbardensis]
MKRSLQSGVLLAAIALLLVAATPVHAAQNCYVKIEGVTQGWIRGDSTITSMDRAEHIEGFEYHHLMEVPSGGSRINHQTVILTKPLDRATPSLLRAMDLNEQLTVQIRFFRPDPGGSGAEQHYYTVLLEGARLISIEPLQGRTDMPDTSSLAVTERLRFSYGQITYTWESNGNEHRASSSP